MPKRTDIRAAIKTLLTGLTTTGANVFDSRVSPLDVNPSLLIMSGENEVFDIENGFNIRRYSVPIEARASGANLDNQLDLIDSEIFTALENSKLGGVAMDTRYLSSTAPELSGEGDAPIGLMTITYEVIYGVN